MKAIIIDNKDARALLEQLELLSLRKDRPVWSVPGYVPTTDDIHRAFRYVVVKWLQEQGADGTP